MFTIIFEKTICHLLPDLSLDLNGLGVARFVESKHGKTALLDKEGNSFYRNRRQGEKSYWLCSQYYNSRCEVKCSARATTKGNNILIWKGEHNHEVV